MTQGLVPFEYREDIIILYADDTTTGTSSKSIEKTVKNLKEDANNVLRYMASNGLIANAKTMWWEINCPTITCI